MDSPVKGRNSLGLYIQESPTVMRLLKRPHDLLGVNNLMFSYEHNDAANSNEQHLVTAQLSRKSDECIVIYKGASSLVARNMSDILNHFTEDEAMLEQALQSYETPFLLINQIMYEYKPVPQTIAYCNFCEQSGSDSMHYCPKCGYSLEFFKRIPVEKSIVD